MYVYNFYHDDCLNSIYKRVTMWPTACVCANDFSSKFDLEVMTDNALNTPLLWGQSVQPTL